MSPVQPKDLNWIDYFRYLILRCILWLTRSSRLTRFAGLYDLSDKDPFKHGTLLNKEEIQEEWPYTTGQMVRENINDTVRIFCASSQGQLLTISLSRRPNKVASVFIYLRTLNSSYSLSKEIVDLSAEDTFSVGGLKIECLIPLMKWRISFNGLLTNHTTGNDDHIRFVFTGNLLNNVADIGTFHNERFLAIQLSRAPSLSLWSLLTDLEHVNKQLKEINVIAQTFSFVGKVKIADNEGQSQEEEVFAFGQKTRSHEKNSSAVESLGSVMAYTRNGISILLEELKVAKFAPSLATGVIHFPSFEQCKIGYCEPNVMNGENISQRFEFGSDGLPVMVFKIEEELDKLALNHYFNGSYRSITLKVLRISYDDKEGFAVFFSKLGDRVEPNVPEIPKHMTTVIKLSNDLNVLSFENALCADGNLTGGKASSLAVLTALSKKSGKFGVPKGLAVTTAAYGHFVKQSVVGSAIQKLELALTNNLNINELQRICNEVVETIGSQQLPNEIKKDVKSQLSEIFDNFENGKYAVRSSACGEDSEEMSAAGQMETLLGVKGLESIYKAISKCWASQFSFVAVQYRRRYGQLINCPMAVCVQEMVASEVSGVMFTVDPVTANPKFITITANYGLGESVVSASADPDTFVLEKTANGAKVFSSTIGAKKLRTVMLEDGGTKDITEDNSVNVEIACLNADQLSQLGVAALEVEKHYASQRDTEWAFAPGGKQLYMLQARPVTSAHVLDTEFEFLHERDVGLSSEYDCLSKANVGEVLGGSVSPLTIELLFGKFLRNFRIRIMNERKEEPYEAVHRVDQVMFVQNGHTFLGTFTFQSDVSRQDIFSKGFAISLYGRVVDDECVNINANNKRQYVIKRNSGGLIKLIKSLIGVDKMLRNAEEHVEKAPSSLKDSYTCREMLIKILSMSDIQEVPFITHVRQLMYGTMNNIFILAILSKAEGDWTPKVYADFSKLVASCNNLVSADVPLSLQKLALQARRDFGDSFKDIPLEEAMNMLQNDSAETSRMFKEFIQRHGHRCINEFDLVSKTWSMDPLPVVKTIQSMIGVPELIDRSEVNINELIDSLQIKLNGPQKFILKFLLGHSRKGIANREQAKSILVMASHKYRLLFRQLANKMVAEGRLPDPDLLFYLYPAETLQLIETRSPKIIVRAMNRMRNAVKTAKDIYPELNYGVPFKPINWTRASIEAKGSRRMTGTPVSQGVIAATARVVMSLEDADQIQKGDILITYATDIGWSPYFPLLSGIVTELGGLVSHGAVVAREYGLPCIVAAHGATQLFRSGEQVLLDGTKGILQTIDDDGDVSSVKP